MRTNFWRGVIAGGVIGAALCMMMGERRGYISKAMAGRSAREAGGRARRVMRGVAKSVNKMIK